MTETRRGPLQRFWEFSERAPSRPRQVFLVLLGVGMTWAMWDRRGAVAGLVALVVYGAGLAVAALQHARVVEWSRRHPLLDSLVLIPASFLALAYLTRLELVWCALAGVAMWAALLPVRLVLHRKQSAYSASRSPSAKRAPR